MGEETNEIPAKKISRDMGIQVRSGAPQNSKERVSTTPKQSGSSGNSIIPAPNKRKSDRQRSVLRNATKRKTGTISSTVVKLVQQQ